MCPAQVWPGCALPLTLRGLGSRERHPAQHGRNSWASPGPSSHFPSPLPPQPEAILGLFPAVEEVTAPLPHPTQSPLPALASASKAGPRVLPSVAQRGRAGPGQAPSSDLTVFSVPPGAMSWDRSSQRSGAFSPQRLCQRLAEQGKPGVFELGQCALCQLKKKAQRESCKFHLKKKY